MGEKYADFFIGQLENNKKKKKEKYHRVYELDERMAQAKKSGMYARRECYSRSGLGKRRIFFFRFTTREL